MDFHDQVIDMEGYLLLFMDGILINAIPCNWAEKDSTSIRYKNGFEQVQVLDTDKYQHIAFRRNHPMSTKDVILLK